MKGLTAILFFTAVFLPAAGGLSAQQDYFLFIQDTERRPFYLRVGEHSYSSSATGHLIFSSLRDTVLNFFIGFPKARYPEQQFRIEVGGRDRGFELKQVNGGWKLFDLRALRLIDPLNADRAVLAHTRKTDSYSQLMAGLVDDSTVLYASAHELEADSLVADSGRVRADAVSPGPPVVDDTGTVNPGPPATARAKGTVSVNPARPLMAAGDTAARKPGAVAANGLGDTALATVVKPDSGVVARDTSSRVKPADTGAMVAARDSLSLKPGRPVAPGPDTTAVTAKAPEGEKKPAVHYDRRDIIRFSTENVLEGKLIIYHDRSGPVTDTIRILIPRL